MPASRGAGGALLVLALCAGFAFWAARLLERRLAGGDVYPASSSLKTDPDGARAFYEALQDLRGAGVRRNFEPVGRLAAGPHTALLVLGTEPEGLEEAGRREAERLDAAVRSGARLVIALSPSRSFWRVPEPTRTPKSGKPSAKKGDAAGPSGRRRPERAEEPDEDAAGVSLARRWGLALDWAEPFEQPASALLAAGYEAPGLPPRVPWKAGSSFAKLDLAWRAVYAVSGKPVLVERTLGRGSIVLATDSTFTGNQALKVGREPALLAWLVGDKAEIVFDETHLGLGEHEGIAALARRYRLEGLFAGLLLLALLFVWKSAAPFPPAPDPGSRQPSVAGRPASEGLAAVLRRHVAAEDLARTCFEEWKKAFARQRPAAVRELSRSAADKDPVAAYRRASTLTKERGLP